MAATVREMRVGSARAMRVVRKREDELRRALMADSAQRGYELRRASTTTVVRDASTT